MTTRTLSLGEAGAIEDAARSLARGDLVALPTETVYGLAADATNGAAIARLYEAKGRPSFNPLIAHVSAMEMAASLASFSPVAERLATLFWPGPLTLVLPSSDRSPVHPLVRAGLETIALRMPRGAAREIVARLGRPVAAPSANPSGRVSATSAEQVLRGLGGRIELVLDGGRTSLGLESTILKPDGERLELLRSGALTAEEIADAVGIRPVSVSGVGIEAPGQMTSHYAPLGRLRLDAAAVEPGEWLLAFGEADLPGAEEAAGRIDLSRVGDLREAAARLFDALGRLDAAGAERIAVAPIPREGLGVAINDRLARAAAPR